MEEKKGVAYDSADTMILQRIATGGCMFEMANSKFIFRSSLEDKN